MRHQRRRAEGDVALGEKPAGGSGKVAFVGQDAAPDGLVVFEQDHFQAG